MHSSATRSARVGPQKLYNKLISKINNFPHKSNKAVAKQQQSIVPPLQSEQKQKTLLIETVQSGSNQQEKSHHQKKQPVSVVSNGRGCCDHDYENVLVVPLSRLPPDSKGDNHNKQQHRRNKRSGKGGGATGDGGGRMIPLTATAAALFSSASDKEDSRSLEDEIFEELEKVAHDEAKLCAALENFDKILSEYNERGSKVKPSRNRSGARDQIAVGNNSNGPGECPPLSCPNVAIDQQQQQHHQKRSTKHDKAIAKQRQDHPKKIFQKSKTCSIIESKCILKKASSDDETSLSSSSLLNAQLPNVCLARSLLNLKDLEEFAKNSRDPSSTSPTTGHANIMERVSHKYNTYKVKDSHVVPNADSSESPSPKTAELRSQLPRAKSVWELGGNSTPPPNSHSPASRTNSGSKIPVSTSSSRSNSFILSSGSTMSLLSVSAAKLNDCRLKQNSEATVVNGGNKIRSSTSTSSICVRPVTGRIQSAISEMSLRSQSRAYKKSKDNGDELLNKCLEKGHEILKKVEELSSSSHHQNQKEGKVKLTVKSTVQSHGVKSNTSSRIRLGGSDDADGIRTNSGSRPSKSSLPGSTKGNNSKNNNVSVTNNRKDNISCSSLTARYFLNSNDDISLHGHGKIHHKSSLEATTSCPATASTSSNNNGSPSDRSNKKQHNNTIGISSSRKQTNSSATQTSTPSVGMFESRSSQHPASSLSRAVGSIGASVVVNSIMEQRNIGVKSKNIVKNCISNFENQCKTSGQNNGRVVSSNCNGKPTKFRAGPSSLSNAGAKVSSAGSEKKQPINWRQSSFSVLTVAPPLKSPALVKQNKLTTTSGVSSSG